MPQVWAHKQTNGEEISSSQATITHQFASPVTPGSLLIASVMGTFAAGSTCADSVNSAYGSLGTMNDGGSFSQTTFVKYNTGAGQPTVTVTFPGGGSSIAYLLCAEYSGIKTSAAADKFKLTIIGANTGGTDEVTTDAVSDPISEADELVWSCVTTRNGFTAINPGTGFTERGPGPGEVQHSGGWFYMDTEDRHQSSIATCNGVWTIPGTGSLCYVTVITFKQQSSGAAPSLPPQQTLVRPFPYAPSSPRGRM